MAGTGGWRGLAAIVFGLACGASLFFDGAYHEAVWGPAALVLLGLVVALAVGTDAVPRGPAVLAPGGLLGLWLLAYLSRFWAESVEAALGQANRWALYAAAFAALVLLLRRPRHATVAIGAAGAAVLCIGLYLLGRMAVGEGAELFFLPASAGADTGARLSGPLGYVNGQAMFLLLGLWPLMAVAERVESRWSAPAFAGATALAALTFLAQSRGVLIAFVGSVVAVLALFPGRAARLRVLAGIGVALALLWAPLQDVYDHTSRAGLDASAQRCALLILVVAAVAGPAWAVANARLPAVLSRIPLGFVGTAARRLARWPLPAAPVLIVAALLATPFLAERAHTALHGFTHLREGTESSRLLSSEGYRYDYWRVAASEFREHPIRGVGAGNYPVGYYASRRTSENISQPHSLEAQTLAELGLVGLTALVAFVGGVLWGLARSVVRRREDAGKGALAVAASGMFIAWFVHTSVDWIHLIPGVTGLGLLAAAVLVAPWAGPGQPGARRRLVALVAVLAAVAFAALEIGRGVVAGHERGLAEEKLATDPAAALEHANRALSLRPDSVTARYVKAAAFARQDDYRRAELTLLQAAQREPNAFVTWVLLGDLAGRRGDQGTARGYYTRALGLNPRDADLAGRARGAP